VNRYIRVDTMWSSSDWLAVLSAEARLVWIELLCYTKNAGRDGKVKALNPIVAGRMWSLGEESVRQLLLAAEKHGAIRIEGQNWVVAKWPEYQSDSTAAERKRKQREREKVTECHDVSRVSQRVTVSSRETEKEKETENNPPKPPLGAPERQTGIGARKRNRKSVAEIEELVR